MAKPGTVTGWKLPREEREALLQRFPPKYENVIADHVTLRVGATQSTPLPRKPGARVVGRADRLAKDARPEEAKVEDLFLATLARRPKPEELQAALGHIAAAKNPAAQKQAYENILWALVNTKEFLFVW